MGLLSIKEREKQLEYLGFKYDKSGIKKFQKESGQTVDGDYGPCTDNALRTWYNVYKNTKNFKPTEFKCECGGKYCKGYPTYMKADILKNLQTIRTHYGEPITVTCGMRCSGYNKALNGSISNSNHLTGNAVDFYQKGVTDNLANRKKAIKFISTLKNINYMYGNGVGYNAQSKVSTKPNAPYMGNALHIDVKKNK